MTPVLAEHLVAVAGAARRVCHGDKGAIYRAACHELGLSRATLLRKLKAVSLSMPRRRRSDAGNSSLTRDEAMLISAMLLESMRKNGKRLYSVVDATAILRANGMIRAASLDASSGELQPLSESALHRALRCYGLHPDQLLAPAPVAELASLHPNHVWQIDASLCVLYYLRPDTRLHTNGLRVMTAEVFYKNKPANLERIANQRVWRYAITDHASGWLYVEYVLGAESGENLCSVLINAMQRRAGPDLMHGVPRILVLDPGAANTAAMTRNLCRSLNIELIVNQAGNARAKGQVENAHNLIERKLEPGLKFLPVSSLTQLNELARRWRCHFNASAQHRRHGQTRNAVWMRISSDQLIEAPALEVCRELAVAQPESRKVSSKLRVSFRGREFDVSTVPGVMVGEKLMVTSNPWDDAAAKVVMQDASGGEIKHVVHEVQKSEFGFSTNAATIGRDFKRHAYTAAQRARQTIERIVTEADSPTAVSATRKAKALPFRGRLDPYRHLDNAALPAYLPRRGSAHSLTATPLATSPSLSLVTAARQIKPAVEAAGRSWGPEHFRWLERHYPVGVPPDQLTAIVGTLIQTGIHVTPLLHIAAA